MTLGISRASHVAVSRVTGPAPRPLILVLRHANFSWYKEDGAMTDFAWETVDLYGRFARPFPICSCFPPPFAQSVLAHCDALDQMGGSRLFVIAGPDSCEAGGSGESQLDLIVR